MLLPAATHPLAPLTTNELRAAGAILLQENKITTNTLLPIVTLREPSKEAVLQWRPGASVPREANVTAYELESHRVYEAIVNLDQRRVTQWKHRPGVNPLQSDPEFKASAAILKTNEIWKAALLRRGIANVDLVSSAGTPGALIPFPGAENVRLLRVSPFLRLTNRMTWTPVEGLSAVIDLSHRKVLEVVDRGVVPMSSSSTDIFDPAVRGHREPLKPLTITQPQGVSFTVNDHAVAWDRWRFRYSFNAREGLVLHQIGWEETPGQQRPILYRASVSDLLVAYGDPDPAWSWRAFFDESDYGFGYCAVPLVRGVTTVGHATLLNAALPDAMGGARELLHGIDIYERDVGTLWSHSDQESEAHVGPRARELVIGYLATVGNYDYRFQWSFRQDGSLEFHVYLTGLMQLKGTHAETCTSCAELGTKGRPAVAPGEQAYGVLVADHLLAPHHQHFFNLRLDFDVDGPLNSVKEMNVISQRRGAANPHGNGFVLSQKVFTREREAARDIKLESHRMWAVFSPNAPTTHGHPPAYLLEPGMNTVPFLSKDSPARQRAGFIEHHFFATRYRETELFAGGDYSVTTAPPNNLLTWVQDNERIQNQDVVLWYTLGLTHVARPEEFPVMPGAHANLRLVPKSFFRRNPALEVPDSL